jgi:predicted aspartyl protease
MDGKAIELEALVDTGATFTKISQRLASTLGLQVKYETEVELADGRLVNRELALAEVELEGGSWSAAWEMPIAFENFAFRGSLDLGIIR